MLFGQVPGLERVGLEVVELDLLAGLWVHHLVSAHLAVVAQEQLEAPFDARAVEEALLGVVDVGDVVGKPFMVRRQRAVGLRGLGQALKSFRDHRCYFPIYEDDHFDTAYLDSLGPLVMPKQGATQGIGELAPEETAPLTDPGEGTAIHQMKTTAGS